MNFKSINTIKAALALCLSIISVGCSNSSSDTSSRVATTSVSGVVMAGPASGASVTVKTVTGIVVTGPVTTGTDGAYSVAIPDTALSADLIFEASGGTFSDEATATNGVVMGRLTSHVIAGSLVSGSNVAIDPSTTIIQKLIAGGKTKTAAEADFSKAFGYTPDSSIKPVFAGISSASTTSQRLAGVRAAAFSQLAKDLSLSPDKQFDLINSIATDLADGTLDGGYAVATKTIPADISNRFGQALLDFQKSSNNKSKLTPDQIGAPVFNKVAYTSSYKIEYVPGTMAAATGKTTFEIKVSDLNGTPLIGKTVSLLPYMYMATKSHTTPVEAVIDNGDGTYSCTIYYVMSSAMNGMSMGVWELKVTVNTNESVKFYPVVGMPMGSTTLAKLNGINDSILGMAGLEKRTWFLFNDGLIAGMGGTYTFKLFLATKEMGTMLTFPAVITGNILKNEAGALWTVNSIVIKASTDASTWVTASETGNGHWTVPGLSNLTAGTAGKIYVQLSVNNGTTDEQKTTNGFAPGTSDAIGTLISPLSITTNNAFQTFSVTPGAM